MMGLRTEFAGTAVSTKLQSAPVANTAKPVVAAIVTKKLKAPARKPTPVRPGTQTMKRTTPTKPGTAKIGTQRIGTQKAVPKVRFWGFVRQTQ
jgi:hypothetical protein